MTRRNIDVVVAGHICLDLIPQIKTDSDNMITLFQPGKLSEIDNCFMITGGAVANTGIALYKLGFNTKLMGKIGNDVFGEIILTQIKEINDDLAEGMIITAGEQNSPLQVMMNMIFFEIKE